MIHVWPAAGSTPVVVVPDDVVDVAGAEVDERGAVVVLVLVVDVSVGSVVVVSGTVVVVAGGSNVVAAASGVTSTTTIVDVGTITGFVVGNGDRVSELFCSAPHAASVRQPMAARPGRLPRMWLNRSQAVV